MTTYSDNDRVIALAGVFQAARLARDIARTGSCDSDAYTASRRSLFDFEPESVAGVFGGLGGIGQGLRTVAIHLEKPQRPDMEISRYVISLIHLADRLMRSDNGMQNLHTDLTALARRLNHFDLSDSVQNEQLSEIYQERISPLGPRIMVQGEPLHLQNPENTSRVRAALLAGIRAAVLWRQAGGNKWQLLLKRRAIARSARDMVDNSVD